MADSPFLIHRPHEGSAAKELFMAGMEATQKAEERKKQHADRRSGAKPERVETAGGKPLRVNSKQLNYRWCAPCPRIGHCREGTHSMTRRPMTLHLMFLHSDQT